MAAIEPVVAEFARNKREMEQSQWLQKPSMAQLCDNVNNPLLEDLCSHMEADYQSKPMLEYSRCFHCSLDGMSNIKKAGRTLCALYPMEGLLYRTRCDW
jgi:AraC family transcriptional regulator